jgi:hypothetical protein
LKTSDSISLKTLKISVNDSAAKVNVGVIGPGLRAVASVRMIGRRLQFFESSNGAEVLPSEEMD